MPERAALIALLIANRPLCIDCIVLRSETPAPVVEHYLERIRDAIDVFRRHCSVRALRKVYSLTQPPL